MRGKLQIVYQVNGKRRFETLPLTLSERNMRAAATIRANRIAESKYGKSEPASMAVDPVHEGSFAEVAQAYLNAREVKESTRNSYRDSLNNYWLTELGYLDIADISAPRIRQLDREIEWPSIKTRQNAATALRQVFTFAVEEGYIVDNPSLRLVVFP